MKAFPLACILITFLLFILPPIVNTQAMRGCSFQGLNLEKCLNEVENSVNFGSCCMVINQAVETGFYCVCSMLASAGPLLSAPLSVQVSNCNISIPPLAQCQAIVPILVHPPPTNPALPVFPPSDIPILPLPVSTPTSFLLPSSPPPPRPENDLLNSTTGVNSTVVQREPIVINNTATMLTVYTSKCEFSGGYETIISVQLTLVSLVLALYSSMN